MSNFKRFLLLLSVGVVLLAGLIFTANTKVGTAFASGCNTVAEGYFGGSVLYRPNWNNTCTVQQGDTSNPVYAIQVIINNGGFYDTKTGQICNAGTPDGIFGQHTFNAVECFQTWWNALGIGTISVDGIVGPQTWHALSYQVLGGGSPFKVLAWNYFADGSGYNDFRMWGLSPFKWYVDAGGCWRQMDVNSSSCS